MEEKRIGNLYEQIAAAKLDPAVGIRIAHLTGSESFSFFGAEIAPHKRIAAHYHKSGEEIYLLIEGEGIMYTGKPDMSGKVEWNPPLILKKGDSFTISQGEVHQLFNDSDNRIIVVFGCPASHLSTDRIIVEGFLSPC
ncbi:MAG: cupin domain-containing protein [Bacillota bacterium]